MNESHFSRKLREVRERAGLTQGQVARVLGVSQALVSLWEKGSQSPSAWLLERLASLYGVKSESLFAEGPVEYRANTEVLFGGEAGSLPPEVVLEVREWLEWLDSYADFLQNLGEGAGPGGGAASAKPFEDPLTDVRQAPTQALRARRRYDLGLGPVPELHAFLDGQGILVYKGHLPAGSGVWGAFYRHPQLGFSLFVNVNATPGRRVFTLAHGLAHALYHYHLPGLVCRREGLSPEEAEAERFANVWAAHFLVPGRALKGQAKRLGELSPETALLLANHFRVSYTFILFRLRNEGLIGEEELEKWSRYRLEDLALRAGVFHRPPAPAPQYLDLERYPPSALLRIRKAVEEGHLSVSGAAALLRADSTTVERELLAEPGKGENRESEECGEDLRFTAPGRKRAVASVKSNR